MKKLPVNISNAGFTFTQLKREGRVCIYEQVPDGGEFKAYEVIIIKYRKERQLYGKVLPAQEAYPSDSDWGTLGWTFMTWDKAEIKFNELVIRYNNQNELK